MRYLLFYLFIIINLLNAGGTGGDIDNCTCDNGGYYIKGSTEAWITSYKITPNYRNYYCYSNYKEVVSSVIPRPNKTGTDVWGYLYDCTVCKEPDIQYPPIDSSSSYPTSWSEYDDNASLLSNQCINDFKGIIELAKFNCILHSRCKVSNGCDLNDTQFPTPASNQREVLPHWTDKDTNLTQACYDLNGTVEDRRVSCVMEHRCMKKTQICPIESNENISSYVSPRDGVFHEDIEVAGTDFGLHYSSAMLGDNALAQGWSISSHAKLADNKIYSGGSIYAVTQSRQEDNLTVVTYGEEEMLFDAEGNLQSTRDLYTKKTKNTFGYDSVGRLTTLTDMHGLSTTLERNSGGNDGTISSITAPYGQTTYLQVDTQGDLVEVQYEDTTSYTFEYENHLMTLEREPNGNAFLHFFDAQSKVIKVIDAEQGEWLFGSSPQENAGTHTVTRASGDAVTYTNHFLENGILKSEKTLPTGDVVLYENAVDESSSSSTTCGMKTTNVYKKNADGTLYTDPYTNRRVFQNSTTTTPNGLKNVVDHTKTYFHDKDSSLTRIDDINVLNGKSSIQRKNLTTHRDISISPLGKSAYVQYDEKMQTPLSVQPYGLTKTVYSYDAQGKVTQETTGTRVTRYAYDGRGNLQSSTNPLNQTTTYSYDAKDRLTEVTHPDGTQESYAYDSNGNLVTRTVPTPTDHTFAYNGVNKQTVYTSPEQKVTTYSYDKQRRVTKVTKPSGKTIDTTYTQGRVTSLKTPESTTDYAYSCQSNVSTLTKEGESIHYGYDGTLLTDITQSGLLNQSIHYSYNNDFLVASMTYAGSTENYSYNLDSQPVQMGAFTLTRSNADRNTTITDGHYTKQSTINTYAELQKTQDNALSVTLARNNAGQITRKIEILSGKRSVYLYTYDERGRLTKVTKNNKETERYTYDSNGNRASATVNNKTTTASYTLDDGLQVYGDNTYRYDDDGYLAEKTTADGTTTYSYGTLGELKEVQTPTQTITYQHNALNQRVAKKVNGQIVEKYLWANLTTLLAIYDKDDTLVQRFDYADQRMPLSMTSNGTKYYLHYDQVGSLRAVSETNGQIVKEVVYDTFGNIVSDTNPNFKVPFGFAGGLYDTDTKLTRFGYRDYDAQTGKWTAKDPIDFAGGDSNLYGYVLGNPVNWIDSNGLFRFGERPLSGTNFTFDLPFNLGLLHEHGFFDNGANVGYFPSGVSGDNPNQIGNYTLDSTYYDDNIMQDALIELLNRGKWLPKNNSCKDMTVGCGYNLVPHNCQDFADDLKQEYFRQGGTIQ